MSKNPSFFRLNLHYFLIPFLWLCYISITYMIYYKYLITSPSSNAYFMKDLILKLVILLSCNFAVDISIFNIIKNIWTLKIKPNFGILNYESYISCFVFLFFLNILAFELTFSMKDVYIMVTNSIILVGCNVVFGSYCVKRYLDL